MLTLSNKLRLSIDKFQNSTEVLPIWGGGYWSGVSPLGASQLWKKLRSKLPIFNNCGAHFSVGKIIYWVGNFGQWAG